MSIDPADPRAVAEFVRRQAIGVVATVTAEGRPEAALVGLTARDDGTLIFDAPIGSRKIANIGAVSEVAVVVGTDGDLSVQLEGSASIATGDDRLALGASYTEQFPGSRALDDDFAIVAVEIAWVRVYDTGAHPAVVDEARWR
ncbi:pyridoxamine 5'-phosphate oxidase family protein [Leifsonia poae]|uniref:pyridoxamine 5'-phosphate oxidase family protein n=1 Tax=Leifsonia poae TaxID=110933 RepID=UPI001CBFC73D|nr:pyridoxamine 5'-phosphate oxidase family protein [Leifsonia poae]